jgi:uncharacterized RDD family membrane protein YckC
MEAKVQYTREQEADIKTRFSVRRRRQIILAIPVVAVVILLAFGDKQEVILGIPLPVVGAMALVLIVGALGFSLYNWRCPACNKYLGKGMTPKFCAKCGVGLS